MDMKKIMPITISVIAVVCILLGILLATRSSRVDVDNGDNSDIVEDNENSNQSSVPNRISYSEAVSIAESLYKQKDNSVKVIEEDNRYVIEVRDVENVLKNKFYLDKKTGSISDAGVSVSDSDSSG